MMGDDDVDDGTLPNNTTAAPPVCVDVTAQLLGGDDEDYDEDGDLMLVPSQPVLPIDALFDTIVGVIQQFMCDLCLDQRLAADLPPLNTIQDDHARHTIFTKFIEKIDGELDEGIEEALEVFNAEEVPQMMCAIMEDASIEDKALPFPTPVTREYVEKLVAERKDEMGPEVEEFVTAGCLDYPSFLALWGQHNP